MSKGDREEETEEKVARYQVESCGSPAWYWASLMNGRGFVRIDGEGVLPSGEDWYITVTFPTPPKQGCRDVHVLSVTSRGRTAAGLEPFRYHSWKELKEGS